MILLFATYSRRLPILNLSLWITFLLPWELLAKQYSFKSSDGLVSEYTVLTHHKKATDLLVFFHGSGGAAGYAQPMKNLKTIADDYGFHIMSIKAPTGNNWPNPDFAKDNGHITYAHEAIQQQVKALGIKKVVFLGWSAGSTFLVGDFIPVVGSYYQGGAIMLCGGGRPYFDQFYRLSLIRKNMRLYFRVGSKDFLYDQVREVIAHYQKAQIKLSYMLTKEKHCGFSLVAATREGLQALDFHPIKRY